MFSIVLFLRFIAPEQWFPTGMPRQTRAVFLNRWIKCFDTHIYTETQCLQTNEMRHYGKGKCLRGEGWSRERVGLHCN
jgi:hypothetical protein